jgi:hypothetical protein
VDSFEVDKHLSSFEAVDHRREEEDNQHHHLVLDYSLDYSLLDDDYTVILKKMQRQKQRWEEQDQTARDTQSSSYYTQVVAL